MIGRIDQKGKYRVIPESIEEAFVLGALWESWRDTEHKRGESVILELSTKTATKK